MDQTSREELYKDLTLLSDWMGSGRRKPHPKPDFQEAPPAGKQASAQIAAQTDASLEPIEADVLRCEGCRLSAGRNHIVFGAGVPSPEVLVVGEGPGAEEDAQGVPFVGPAGKLLDKMLSAIDLDRTRNCYIANIVKCRPPMNRDPAPDEREACLPYLKRQIRVLKPRIILALGRTAIQSLLGTAEGIGKLRGRLLEFDGIPLLATYHPSALLRDETLKRPAWEDLKKLRAILDGKETE
jgi:uracil-DNA glycosylase